MSDICRTLLGTMNMIRLVFLQRTSLNRFYITFVTLQNQYPLSLSKGYHILIPPGLSRLNSLRYGNHSHMNLHDILK